MKLMCPICGSDQLAQTDFGYICPNCGERLGKTAKFKEKASPKNGGIL